MAALDRDLSNANDEDDGWDFTDADGEQRNGTRGMNLFAGGVEYRYRHAVFRKGSTPNRSMTTANNSVRLSAVTNGSSSPSLTAKDHRGRPALSYRRKTFLHAKSLRSSLTGSSQSVGKSFTTISERGGIDAIVAAERANYARGQPSFKPKESAVVSKTSVFVFLVATPRTNIDR